MCFLALRFPWALYLLSCSAAAQNSPGQGKGAGQGTAVGVAGGGAAVGISKAQLDSIGCPVLPSRSGTGTLVWDYDPTRWPDANYSQNAIEDPTVWTSLKQAGWSGHWAIVTEANTCGSLEVLDKRGTSILWKEITVGPGKVFRITVQLMVLKHGSKQGLVNGQLVIYGCSAIAANLTQMVEISRMTPTQFDDTMGPPVQTYQWMTMVALVRTTHVQLNHRIAIALVTGGKGQFKLSLVRVEDVNPSVCSSQNCSDMKDCSDFPGLQAKHSDTISAYKPGNAAPCLVNHSRLALPAVRHSRPVMHAGRLHKIVFGYIDTEDTMKFNAMLIAQILLNEVIGVETGWRDQKMDEVEVFARVAGYNITRGAKKSNNLTIAIASAPKIDLSIDAPLDWVGMPMNPASLWAALQVLPHSMAREKAIFRAHAIDLGLLGVSSYDTFFITVPAVAKANQNGVVLDSWATLSRNFAQHSPPVYSYFNDPESWTSVGGFEYESDIKCSSKSSSPLRSQLEGRGYKCWAEAWWASPNSENYTVQSKGKTSTKYRCIPFIVWNSVGGTAVLHSMFDIIQNIGMKLCITDTVAGFKELVDKGYDFVTWISFPGMADPKDVNIVDLPAQYVPIRVPYKKIMWQQLEIINRQTFELLTDFMIPEPDVIDIIRNVRNARLQDQSKSDFVLNYAEACSWVKKNELLWKQWLAVKCNKGFVSAEVDGFITCVKCPAGKFNNVLGVDTTCKNCSVGSYSSSQGVSQCDECKTGHYRDYEGAEDCARCIEGQYSDVGSATACKSCQDILAGSTTKLLGAQNASDCACQRKKFNPRDYEAGSSAGCQPCPEGIACPGFAVLGQPPPERLMPGYYLSPFNPINKAWQCASDKACPGTKDQPNNDNPCADKRQGLNCGLCARGHYAVGQGSACIECNASAWVLPVALVLFFWFSGVFHYLWNERAAYVEAGESVLASVTMGVTLAFLQTLGIFDNLHFSWPQEFASLLDFARLFVFDLQFLRPSCLFAQTLPTAYLGRLLVPLVLTGIFLVWFPASRVLHVVSRFPIFAMRGILNSVGMIVQAVYISLVTSSVSLMECYRSPNGKYTVRGYPYAQCFTTQHLSLIPAMVIAFIVYVIGVFVLFAWLCHVAPRKQGNAFFRHATRFLVFKFHPAKWWYGLVLMIRSLSLALVTVVEPSDGYRQFIMMLFILIGSVFIHLECKPYSDWYANMLESVELSLLIAILGIGSWFIEERDYDGTDRAVAVVFSILMCTCVGLCVFVLVVVFVYAVWIAKYPQKWRAGVQKEVDGILKKLMPCVTHLATAEEKEVENMLMGATYLDRVYCRNFMNFALLEFSGMQSDKYGEQRLTRQRASFVKTNVTTLSETKLHTLKRTVSEEFVKKQLDSHPVCSWSGGRQTFCDTDQAQLSESRLALEEATNTKQFKLDPLMRSGSHLSLPFEEDNIEQMQPNPLIKEEDVKNDHVGQSEQADAIAAASTDATSADSFFGQSVVSDTIAGI